MAGSATGSCGWKADLIFRQQREFGETEFARPGTNEIFGIEVDLPTLEDLMIAKLESSELGDSELQRRDNRELLELAADPLDETYLSRWITRLGLAAAWERVRRSE